MKAEQLSSSMARSYWRSLDSRVVDPGADDPRRDEFDGVDTQDGGSGLSRRGFLTALGAAAAGGALVTGCRKPREKIMPYVYRPEDLVPGRAQYYATAGYIRGSVLGLLVESHEGRPTKIEGNPGHPMSKGRTNVWAQAEMYEVYSRARSEKPLLGGKPSTWAAFDEFVEKRMATEMDVQGAGLGLLLRSDPSPVLNHVLMALKAKYPQARLYRHDPVYPVNARQGWGMIDAAGTAALYDMARARVVVALDADLLATEPDAVLHAAGFAEGRRMPAPQSPMNRLYVVEGGFSLTGGMADNRLRLPSSQIGEFLRALVDTLFAMGLPVPVGGEAVRPKLAGAAPGGASAEAIKKWTKAVAADLVKNQGQSAVVVGSRQPPWVHALAAFCNAALGNIGPVVKLMPELPGPAMGTLADFAADLKGGAIKTVFIGGGNPVYEAPVDMELGVLLGKAANSICLAMEVNETAKACNWHLPQSHFLESWGDLRAPDGTVSIQQPLIAPLHGTRSVLEMVARMAGMADPSEYGLVKGFWAQQANLGLGFEKVWRRWLHEGVVSAAPVTPAAPVLRWTGLMQAMPDKAPPAPTAQSMELNFTLCSKLVDGRYNNNGWLQELPESMSKLTWDNAALMNAAAARALGIELDTARVGTETPVVELSYKNRMLKMPAFVVPGLADHTVFVALGYGRTVTGEVGQGAGFNAGLLRTSDAPWFGTGLVVSRSPSTYLVASTQKHGEMVGRPIVREATVDEYRKDPQFAPKMDPLPASRIKSLWVEPNPRDGHQWGMSIDLNTCTGCNTCAIACQAENNIAVVGKERVARGRELSWMRLDRYFTGSEDNPEAVMQPVACAHCETAPCESVCPVAATTHSPEGLNDMAYNRCIGTRYCQNNCPYKVRRFNYFNYINDYTAVEKMQKNPDVTIRFRGVIEKCTYCVQRINEAKIDAKVGGNGKVADGAIVPACQQACPVNAIVFGDINDPQSAVSKMKKQPRDYALLSELNIKPRTTYLAKLRNPNPELA